MTDFPIDKRMLKNSRIDKTSVSERLSKVKTSSYRGTVFNFTDANLQTAVSSKRHKQVSTKN